MTFKLIPFALAGSVVLLSGCASADVPSLAGRSMMWAEVISKDCEIPPEVEFGKNGELTGNTACNPLSGTYVQDGSKVDFSGAQTGKRTCGPKLMEVENRLMKNLKAARSVKFDGDKVTFADAQGKTLMTLVPMQPGSCD